MAKSLLNLISTPVPVLNSIGLNLRVGLSSEDPTTLNHPTESYTAFLTTYSPEGVLMQRSRLGEIPPNRRKLYNLSGELGKIVPGSADHLAVVHRIPTRMLSDVDSVESEIDLPRNLHYPFFRTMVEYSFPNGGNGSVIYETPPSLNSTADGRISSNTLIFTCQIVLSELLNSYLVLIHYSVEPSYVTTADFGFAVYSLSGEQVVTEHIVAGPFSVKVLDMRRIIPANVIKRETDPQDGQAAFTLTGYSEGSVLIPLIVNAAPELGSVGVEHTHPPQAYLLPPQSNLQRKIKIDAERVWDGILAPEKSLQ
jgi:hypothetical protein